MVFFQDQGFRAADPNTLIMGNPENKRKVYDFLDKMFVRGKPIRFRLRKRSPNAAGAGYLLTDGDFGPKSGGDRLLPEAFGETKTKITPSPS